MEELFGGHSEDFKRRLLPWRSHSKDFRRSFGGSCSIRIFYSEDFWRTFEKLVRLVPREGTIFSYSEDFR